MEKEFIEILSSLILTVGMLTAAKPLMAGQGAAAAGPGAGVNNILLVSDPSDDLLLVEDSSAVLLRVE